jgi:hypothetical protein
VLVQGGLTSTVPDDVRDRELYRAADRDRTDVA